MTLSSVPIIPSREFRWAGAYSCQVNPDWSFVWEIHFGSCDIWLLKSGNPVWPMPWPGQFAVLSCLILRELDKNPLTNAILPMRCLAVIVVLVFTACGTSPRTLVWLQGSENLSPLFSFISCYKYTLSSNN